MGRADALLVLGASFSDHTGIAPYIPTIQVDLDPMTLGKFHAVHVPLLGDISVTCALLRAQTTARRRPEQRDTLEKRWERWRTEKASRQRLVPRRRAASQRRCSPRSPRPCPRTR